MTSYSDLCWTHIRSSGSPLYSNRVDLSAAYILVVQTSPIRHLLTIQTANSRGIQAHRYHASSHLGEPWSRLGDCANFAENILDTRPPIFGRSAGPRPGNAIQGSRVNVLRPYSHLTAKYILCRSSRQSGEAVMGVDELPGLSRWTPVPVRGTRIIDPRAASAVKVLHPMISIASH